MHKDDMQAQSTTPVSSAIDAAPKSTALPLWSAGIWNFGTLGYYNARRILWLAVPYSSWYISYYLIVICAIIFKLCFLRYSPPTPLVIPRRVTKLIPVASGANQKVGQTRALPVASLSGGLCPMTALGSVATRILWPLFPAYRRAG